MSFSKIPYRLIEFYEVWGRVKISYRLLTYSLFIGKIMYEFYIVRNEGIKNEEDLHFD